MRMSDNTRAVQVGEVREIEVKAARLEGASDARQLVEQERSQLQRLHEEQLQQLKAQEHQVAWFVHSCMLKHIHDWMEPQWVFQYPIEFAVMGWTGV